MEQWIKNMEPATVLNMAGQVECQPGQVVSKTLAQNSAISLTLFAFAKGEEISAHESPGDALVFALEGSGLVKIDGVPHSLRAGECIVMPARHPHSVHAPENFKMLLTVVFPTPISPGTSAG